VNTLKGILRTQRQKSTSLEPKFLIDVVSSIQKDGDDLGSRIDESIFSIIVETIIQTDYCIENERALYLLSVCVVPDQLQKYLSNLARLHYTVTEMELSAARPSRRDRT